MELRFGLDLRFPTLSALDLSLGNGYWEDRTQRRIQRNERQRLPPIRVADSIRLSVATRDLIWNPIEPNLVQGIRDEGEVIRENLRMENDGCLGLCLVSSKSISAGSQIIPLLRHIPLTLPPLNADPTRIDAILHRLVEAMANRAVDNVHPQIVRNFAVRLRKAPASKEFCRQPSFGMLWRATSQILRVLE